MIAGVLSYLKETTEEKENFYVQRIQAINKSRGQTRSVQKVLFHGLITGWYGNETYIGE